MKLDLYQALIQEFDGKTSLIRHLKSELPYSYINDRERDQAFIKKLEEDLQDDLLRLKEALKEIEEIVENA